MRQPTKCWIFDAIGVIAWISAGIAYWSLGSLDSAAAYAVKGDVFWRWLDVYSGRVFIICVAPIAGTLFLGFSAIVKQIGYRSISTKRSVPLLSAPFGHAGAEEGARRPRIEPVSMAPIRSH